MQSEQHAPETRSYGPWLVALGAALWGTESAWRIPLTKIFSAEVIVFYEHVLMTFLFLPVIIAQRKYIRQAPAKAYGYLIFSGIAGSAVGTIFFTKALEYGNASVVNVLLNIQPVFSTGLAFFLFRDRLSKSFFFWAPFAILSGMLLSIEHPTQIFSSFQTKGLSLGTLFALTCALFWGMSTVAGRGAMLHIPAPLAAGLRSIIGLLTMTTVLLFTGKFHSAALYPELLSSNLRQTIVLFVLLSTISGGIPTCIYFLGLKYTKASTAGYFEMMQTIAALLVTWVIPSIFPNRLLPSSPLSTHQVIAGAFLIFAVVMVERAQQALSKKTNPTIQS